jgi:hypothetical protein
MIGQTPSSERFTSELTNLEVAACHSARDLALANGSELERVPIALEDAIESVSLQTSCAKVNLDRELLGARSSKLSRALGGRDGSGGAHVGDDAEE